MGFNLGLIEREIMHKFVYDNATVYVTKITPEQEENIRKSTERFVKALFAKGLIGDDYKERNNRGTGRAGSDARKGDQKAKKENSST